MSISCSVCKGQLSLIDEPYHYLYYDMVKTTGKLLWKRKKEIFQVCDQCKEKLIKQGWTAKRKDGYFGSIGGM